jgi:hypothetical protein
VLIQQVWLIYLLDYQLLHGPNTGTVLRVHLACFVANKRFKGSFVSTDVLHQIYKALVPNDCDLKAESLVNAFSSASGIVKSCYGDFIIDDDAFGTLGITKKAVFVACKYRIDGTGERKTAIGCFEKESDIPDKDEVQELLMCSSDEQQRVSLQKNPVAIPKYVKTNFDVLMHRKHSKKIDLSVEGAAAAKKSRYPSKRPPITSATTTNPTLLQREIQLADPSKAIKDLEQEIASDLGKLLNKRCRLFELQSGYKMSEDEVAQALVDSLLYSYGGRLGHLNSSCVKNSCGFVTLDELESGVVGNASTNVDGKEVFFECGEQKYCGHDKYGCWIPWRKELVVDKPHLTKLLQRSDGVQKLLDKFQKGEQCNFDQETHDILSAYSVAASGASDWGKQSLIAGAFKAAFHIMGQDRDQ